ncbi:winged helix-turn-helix transcriptional regulator [Mesorhizobium sp. LSJC264A00]|uniref:AsnC family transcriptional regulator n=1 Tax=Mesorhizobium sp. LSJC264A00 TaxID=1287321 RepID=UPI0003CE5BC2|nr:winged helix-turn-helix transcriptional regulator [Mesorhizobium sp. LSJC264A00]ESX20568.1 transcriptional regulator [Mesorhizobium sp. LSJC264A00]
MREHLDQTDRRLVKLLSQDAQPGINRLAETMAISVPTVRSRLRNLLDRNLLKIVGLLNLTERPELISAIVGINAQGRGRARELAQRIAELPFVNSASVVTGRMPSPASTGSPRRWRSRCRRCAQGCAICSTATS